MASNARWFRCKTCNAICHRAPQSKFCGKRDARTGRLLCGGRLERIAGPDDHPPGSTAWLMQRAMAAAFIRE